MRRRRRELGWSLRRLAEKTTWQGVPVTHSQLSKIERHLSTPYPKLASVLAALLDIDIDDLEKKATR